MTTTNTTVINVSEILSVLADKAKTFATDCKTVANPDTGIRTVKMPKKDKLCILGETRNSLVVSPESLILALGAVQLYILSNPTAVVSPTHSKEFAECLIAVSAATAHVMSEKFGIKAEDASLADKIVKSASNGLTSYFSKKADVAGEALVNGTAPPVEGVNTEQSAEAPVTA